MQEENFTEQDSLKLINEMIGKAKKSYITKGTASIVWGAIIFLCSLVSWSEAHFKYDFPFDIWLLTLVALILQVYFSVKEKRSRQFVSYEGIVITHIWIAFTVSIFILSFYLSRHSQNGQSSSLIMMLYGIPTFITGGVTKFKPMIFGGVFCWVASFVSIYTSIEIDLLLMATCGLFAWLIPGIILWNRYKQNQATNV
jgi:hypothetical protein